MLRPKAAPAVTLAGGCTVITSWAGAAGVTLHSAVGAPARPRPGAWVWYVEPTRPRVRPSNVATPPMVEAVAVPPRHAPVESPSRLSVTSASESDTRLPNASSTETPRRNGDPALMDVGGCRETAS